MAGTSVAIIDSGGANIASLSNAFDRLGELEDGSVVFMNAESEHLEV